MESAKKENSKHFFTSAKTGEGLEELFTYIMKETAALASIGVSKETKSKKLVLSNSTVKQKDKGCCK